MITTGIASPIDKCAKFARNVWWPNIVGQFAPNGLNSGTGIAEGGALYSTGNPSQNGCEYSSISALVLRLDASKWSSTYNGTKMQPAALSALPCIRF